APVGDCDRQVRPIEPPTWDGPAGTPPQSPNATATVAKRCCSLGARFLHTLHKIGGPLYLPVAHRPRVGKGWQFDCFLPDAQLVELSHGFHRAPHSNAEGKAGVIRFLAS